MPCKCSIFARLLALHVILSLDYSGSPNRRYPKCQSHGDDGATRGSEQTYPGVSPNLRQRPQAWGQQRHQSQEPY